MGEKAIWHEEEEEMRIEKREQMWDEISHQGKVHGSETQQGGGGGDQRRIIYGGRRFFVVNMLSVRALTIRALRF